MFKKFVSLLISACLILSAGALSVYAAVWSGGISSTPSLGSDGYYKLTSGEELAWFASAVNSGNNTLNARLSNDIVLNSGSFSHVWTPIGTAQYPFLGNFEGSGYTVSGLYISGSNDYRGLFGYTGTRVLQQSYADGQPVYDSSGNPVQVYVSYGASIGYVSLENANVSGGSYVGGIVGYAVATKIRGCFVSGSVSGSGNNVGGIVGYAFDETEVFNSANNAAVSGVNRVGGIAGILSSDSALDVCTNKGTVSGSNYVGGLAGTSSGSYVVHSYGKGAVSGTNRVGGIVGYSAYAETYFCYTLAQVTSSGSDVGSVFGLYTSGSKNLKVYYNKDICNKSDQNATPAETEVMLSRDFISTLNYGTSSFVEDYFLSNNGFPIFGWEISSWNGELIQPQQNASGTYLISNGAELAWFAGLVNGTVGSQNVYANATLTKDVLLNATLDSSAFIWNPIGSETAMYKGTFDGSGHRISGIYNGTTNNYSDVYEGLFGYIGAGGTVRNLFVESSSFYGYQYVGGITGYNAGTITNCSTDVYINANSNAGGIAGYNEGTITVCCNVGNVNGTNICGGITGQNAANGSITYCFNSGKINTSSLLSGSGSASNIGGIAGMSFNAIQKCYNVGYIKGAQKIGGIVGDNHSSVSFCYNAGYINGMLLNMGAIVGLSTYNASSVADCYYDSDKSNLTDKYATPVIHTGMVSDNALYDFMPHLYADTWVKQSTNTYFDYYPQLLAFTQSSWSYLVKQSEEGARVLQIIYDVRVDIDGETSSYYRELAPAMRYIGTKTATAVIIQDTTMTETATVNGKVTIVPDFGQVTITREWQIETGDMIVVDSGARLTLTGGDESSDDLPLLYIDGGSANGLSGCGNVLELKTGSTLNIEAGTVIRNNASSAAGSAVYIYGADFNMNGGSITGNSTTGNGTVYDYGDGCVTFTGGSITGNTAQKGGAVYVNGNYTDITVSDDIEFNSNTATSGGAVYIENGTFNLAGGSIKYNTATNGGGIYIAAGGTLNQTDGTVKTNTASSHGGGVYLGGEFKVMENASIDMGNDVYVVAGKYIETSEKLAKTGTTAAVTPQSYTVGTHVLGGTMVAKNYTKFKLNTQNGMTLYINSNGYLVDAVQTSAVKLTTYGMSDVEYASIQEAIDIVEGLESGDATADKVGVITLLSDQAISEPVTVEGTADNHVQITILSSGKHTLIRDDAYTGSIFEVNQYATLDLGSTEYDDGDEFVNIDGAYDAKNICGGSLIVNNGELNIYNGTAISGNYSSSGAGAVLNNGTLNMYGGFICNNYSSAGGAAVRQNSGEMQFHGGTIMGNSSVNGGAFYINGGTFTSYGGTVSENSAENGGAVYVAGGTFDFYGSDISFNQANNGGGIYVTASGKLNVSDSVVEITTGSWQEVLDENGDPVLDGDGNVEYEWVFTTRQYNTSPILSANNAAALGGGIANFGTLSVSGGTISFNNALNGNGIYSSKDIRVSGAVNIDTGNDVLITSDKKIIITAPITTATTIMKLALGSYELGRVILSDYSSGSLVGAYYSLVTLKSSTYFIDSEGKISTTLLCPTDSSGMKISDHESIRVLTGLDPNARTVSDIKAGLQNDAGGITVKDLDSQVLSDSDLVTTGCLITLKKSGNIIDSVYIVLVGDVNCDGEIDGLDANYASAVYKGMLGSSATTAPQRRAADANSDHAVDLMDYYALVQAGLMNYTIVQ